MIFLKNFQAKYVEIVAKTSINTEDGTGPLLAHGFVIDADSEFIYLGVNNALQIDSVINRKDVTYICITDPDGDQSMFPDFGNEEDSELN